MRKKFKLLKSIQTALYIVITAAGLIAIICDSDLYQMVGRNPSVRALCILLWIALAASFAGILADFSMHTNVNRENRELDYAVYNDAVAGIANRYSCDAMINKYADKPLPDDIGCIMMDLSNLSEINAEYGHAQGNLCIQDFSDILHKTSVGLCFVGRNGGNKFMALFEECSDAKLNTFLARVRQKVELYNMQEDKPKLQYRCGSAFHEGSEVGSITQLIALADRRITPRTDRLTGIANRGSCDDYIAQYTGRALPENMACVFVEFTNLPAINAACGHAVGSKVLQSFTDLLRESGGKTWFVGRNSGLQFMAMNAKCTAEELKELFSQIRIRVINYNVENPETAIEYRTGHAFREGSGVDSIGQLVTLAHKRVGENVN